MVAARLRSLRAVFFDAGNTLLRMDYDAIARELRANGVVVTAEAVERAEWRARVLLDETLLAAPGPGTSTESAATGDRYLRFLLEGVGVTDEATFERMAAWRRCYNPPVGVWGGSAPAAHAALRLLRAAGLRAAVISNSNGSVRSILESLRLLPYLDFVLDSGELGVEKPDRRIFEIALARAEVRPDEAAYIGDLYSVDVAGARAAGIEPVLLDPGGSWGARDCRSAADVLEATRLLLDGDVDRGRRR